MSSEKFKYTGKQIDVEWDGQLCIHIAECGKSAGELFVGGRNPWCQPDLSTIDDVVDVVMRCPTGALSFTSNDTIVVEKPNIKNIVAVSYNGPYFIRGEIDIDGVAKDMPGIKFRAALCRCGASKNKPFCDNSHEIIGFKDYGAVGERGEDIASTDGILSILPVEDGPLMLTGNITIQNGSGNIAWTGNKVALCRCGASKNKPFCDGSHVAIGFGTK